MGVLTRSSNLCLIVKRTNLNYFNLLEKAICDCRSPFYLLRLKMCQVALRPGFLQQSIFKTLTILQKRCDKKKYLLKSYCLYS